MVWNVVGHQEVFMVLWGGLGGGRGQRGGHSCSLSTSIGFESMLKLKKKHCDLYVSLTCLCGVAGMGDGPWCVNGADERRRGKGFLCRRGHQR